MKWKKAMERLSSIFLVIAGVFIHGSSTLVAGQISRKKISLVAPVKMEFPLPTRGGPKEYRDGSVRVESDNKAVITWKGMKPRPSSQEDCQSSVQFVQNLSSKEDVIKHFIQTSGVDPSFFPERKTSISIFGRDK